jgi:thiamine biosynthesis lipoprotein
MVMRFTKAATLVLFAISFVACGVPEGESVVSANSASQYRVIDGSTMGTYYRIQYRASDSCEVAKDEVDILLEGFNLSLSTYISKSEISKLNRATAGQWVDLTPRMNLVMQAAFDVWQESQGAFDVTIGPLVNLWGFGPAEVVALPSIEAQRRAARWVGMHQLRLDHLNSKALKNADEVYVDMSALAKGLGVDEVADSFAARSCTDYMVDIGGEMRLAGRNAKGTPWRIGVERPVPGRPVPGRQSAIQKVLEVTDRAVATSGDYRNFRQVDGVRIDHVIDPRSGVPADNLVASVTVVHPQAMFADAYATSIMVLGADQGLEMANRLELPVLIVEKSADGRFIERYTAPMKAFLPTFTE